MLQPENWNPSQKILVILAHPDDPEFFCGASIARWTDAGHSVSYLLLTKGDKGGADISISPKLLSEKRVEEQSAAAKVLGVKQITFFEEADGFLQPSDRIRKTIVRFIRQETPDIIVTSDPTNYFSRGIYINHPDHKAAGQITLDAVFPAVGNPLYYPELILEEGLQPHTPAEIWLSLTNEPNITLDVTEYWSRKFEAIREHASQIPDVKVLEDFQFSRHTADSSAENPRFEETFRRLIKR